MCVLTVACPNIVCHYNMLTHVVANLQTWATIRIVGGCFWCKAKALLIDCVFQFHPGMSNAHARQLHLAKQKREGEGEGGWRAGGEGTGEGRKKNANRGSEREGGWPAFCAPQ